METTLTPRGSARSIAQVAAETALRLAVGLLMAGHGWQKVIGYAEWQDHVAQLGIPLPELSARLAVAMELGGGLALAAGLLTPLAGAAVALVMLTAIATVHAGHGPFAQNGGWELPLTFALVAISFALRGPGPVSADAWIARRFGERRDTRAPVPVHAPIPAANRI